MERDFQRQLNLNDSDRPGFTTAQAQYYGAYTADNKFPTEGLPSKYEEETRQQYVPKEQLYIPRADQNYYTNKPQTDAMDRPRGYVSPQAEPSRTTDQRFEVRVTPLQSTNSSYSSYQSPEQYSNTGYSDRNANRENAAISSPGYKDHGDTEIAVPVYGVRESDTYKYPAPAESRLVYTSPQNANFGYAQSRPTGQSPPPPPPPQLNVSSQPYGYIKTGSESPTYAPPSPTYQPHAPPSPAYQPHAPPSPAYQPHAPHSPTYQPRSPDSPKTPLERPYQLMPTMEGGASSYTDGQSKGKEEEVDALTNLLMQNMEAAADPDFFGMCAKCGRAIMGETAGCKALDQLFHVDCFTCISCSTCLRGQPFYAMEGRPYCEPCYVTTLEKCSVCSKPITERILRATGKPYHPKCFKCVVCGTSLDGVPFTVDATNQIHCIQDFHRKFAPRCCVCDLPIMPREGKEEAVRIVAMDKSFHPHCYKCEDCDVVLTSEADGRGCYPLDEHMLCKRCNARRIQHMTTRMPTEL